MEVVVKNTMKFRISELFCPHYCISCGKIGGILCKCCKKYILDERKLKCLNCGAELENNVCQKCDALPCRQFYAGARKGTLKALINAYKYKSVRACSVALAELLAEFIDVEKAAIVPLPTIGKHVRDRGFDHTAILARKLAKMKS